MVSGLIVALTMIGICVVAPTTISLTTRTIVRNSTAKGSALKAERNLRKAIKNSTKDPKKEKKLVKDYYKTKIIASTKVLPNYDNMSKDNYFVKKLSKSEASRQRMLAKVGLAQINGKEEKAEKLRSEMEQRYPQIEFSSKHSFVQTVNMAGVNVELPSNSIHCDTKSLVDDFKTAITSVPEDDRDYPMVMEIEKGSDKIASMTTTSQSVFDKFSPIMMSEIYVKALADEKQGEVPNYNITVFDASDTRKMHQHTYNSAQSVVDCVKDDLKFDLDSFYTIAKDVANQLFPNTELVINGEKLNAQEKQSVAKRQTRTRKTAIKEDISKESIVCDSALTKQKFESTYDQPAFAPETLRKDFVSKVACNGEQISNVTSNSYVRGTTFTVNLLSEAYRTALAYRRDNIPFEIDLTSSYFKSEDGKQKQVVNNQIFSTPESILQYATKSYSITKEKFLAMVAELNTELGTVPTIQKQRLSVDRGMFDSEYKSVEKTYKEATKFYKNDAEGALKGYTVFWQNNCRI